MSTLYILNCSLEQVAEARRRLRGADDPLAYFTIKPAPDYVRILQATKQGAPEELYADELEKRLQEICRDITITTYKPPADY